ncbi:HAD family hydrolase [Staphylococcus chromogenes]|nr:HAD family hydrolase [Staphylococcus chromogenes]
MDLKLVPEPLLIASDVDGTLINDQERIPAHVRSAIFRATRAGCVFALATGRPPRWIRPVLEQLRVRPLCVCANGAIIYDSATDTMVNVSSLAPAALHEVARIAREVLADVGGVGFAVERAGESAFQPEESLFLVSPDYIPAWFAAEFGMVPEAELFSVPAIKLLLRNDQLPSAEIYRLVAPHIPESLAHLTFSVSDGLVEVAAPRVTKATGVQFLAQHIGATARDVVCFGDMPNDIEMLRWAGLGVAMSNAMPEVKAAADLVCGTNNDGGIADVLSRWF